ncbi:MAG: glycosyltransferase family 39 protein [Acidobacteria bacterium]|nr:glycosyltransferase family 39 protein [Acidobacteriota bacterium]
MAPEISPDGAGYHLGLVSRYLREHGFGRITTSMYAMLSQGTEMLFLFAYAFGRHSAAKMIHFAFLLATAAAMVWFGRRFRLREAAAVAAAFFAFSPVAGVDGTSSYNDCALALFTFLTFYLLLVWEENPGPALVPAIGVAAGFCFSIKYTGFLALPFALWFLGRRGALRASVFAACFIAPWMIKNAILIGNPVAPFFNSVFPNPYIHVSLERSYTFLMRHYAGLAEQNWRDYLQYPFELAIRGGKLQGLLGPLFLLAPLGLWSLRLKMGRRLWAAAALFALPWLSNNGTRFLIPSLVFLSLAMAVALWQAPRRFAVVCSAVLVVAHAVASWPPVVGWWDREMMWRLEDIPWRAALRRESEGQYLSRVAPDYNVARMIEQAVPKGARVHASVGVFDSYTTREIIGNYQSALGEVLTDLLLTPVVEPWAPVWNIRMQWEPRALAGLRLIQTGWAKEDQWSIHELLLFSGTTYLVPNPSWLLRASPNPWDAALAVDGNPATRWRSWWPLYPGMRFQVEFPEPLRLSAVELHCSADQYPLELQAEGKDLAGRWFRLKTDLRRSQREPSREEMKRYATREIQRRGVDYLLTDVGGGGTNLMAPSMEKDPSAWGVTKVGEYGPIKLYRIE